MYDVVHRAACEYYIGVLEKYSVITVRTCGPVDRALDSKSKGLGFDSCFWSFVEVSDKLLIPYEHVAWWIGHWTQDQKVWRSIPASGHL